MIVRRAAATIAVILAIAVVVLLTAGPQLLERNTNTVLQPPPYTVSSAARQLHAQLFVADLHADSLLWDRDLLRASSYGHVDIPRLRTGGGALQVFDAVTKVPTRQRYDGNDDRSDIITLLAAAQRWPMQTWFSLPERTLYQAHKLHDVAARSAGGFVVVETLRDLADFIERRKTHPELIAGLLGIEGLHALGGDLHNVDVFRDAGYRIMGLAHFFDNDVSGSAHGISKGGLTDFGRQVVRRMEERSVLVDLAHAAPRAIDDVLAIATRPVIVSHTGVKGTCEHIRNLSDDHVRRIAATGGVIGIGYWDAALCDVSVTGIVRAIRYAVQLAGIDHVALGSDFDGATATPFDTTGLPSITQGLLSVGFSETDVGKVMGSNVLRLLRATLPQS